jgi:hypothetical protein
MTTRWVLSQFTTDPETKVSTPVAASYGGHWMCPVCPADLENGWALVQIMIDPAQVAAAKQDDRIVVCPLLFDPSPAPQQVVDTYASWGVTAGMSMGALIAKLCEKEPCFGLRD